jgi:transcriptional regulator with XRE-family HTH domain
MRDRQPTIRSRVLGEGLRQAMERAELNGKQAAHLLGWSESWVSRLLSGKRGGSALDVAAFLGACRVKAPERDRLLALCQDQHTPGWLQQHGTRLPKQLVTLIKHEDKAVAVEDFQPIFVPGLLQTAAYARAVISRNVNVPPEEVDERVAARLARQILFSRDRPARFTFYIHEFVLRLQVGGAAVMSDQLHHLLRMSVRWLPHIAGGTSVTRRARGHDRGVHAHGVHRVQTGDLPGERDLQPVPGETGGDHRLPTHPGGPGGFRAERGRIERADCHPGNRVPRGSRGPG